MKKLLSLVLLASIFLVTMSARPTGFKKLNKKQVVNVYLDNGTSWSATLVINGYYYYQGAEDGGLVGTTNQLSANVTLSINDSSYHTFSFTGATPKYANGSASWFAVSINGDVTASIY